MRALQNSSYAALATEAPGTIRDADGSNGARFRRGEEGQVSERGVCRKGVAQDTDRVRVRTIEPPIRTDDSPSMTAFFDAHLHIIDPRFPLVENQGFLPKPFTCEDYRRKTAHFEVLGGAVVSGSFQHHDQSYLVDALRRLGPSFVGVTQLPHSVSDEALVRLDQQGVRGIRFNLHRGGSDDLSKLDAFARRVYELVGWHAEIYVDSKALAEIGSILRRLPAVSIDHLGLSTEGFDVLLSLVEKGVRVKATGFGRVDLDVRQAIRLIVSANPDALMFGTELPSTRARRPFHDGDLDLVADAVGDEALAEKVLFRNALDWYRIPGESTRR